MRLTTLVMGFFMAASSYAAIIKDPQTTIVYDTERKLMWYDTALPEQTMTWAEAQTYCQNFSFGTMTEWRLPTRFEVRSLVSNLQGKVSEKPYIRKSFTSAPLYSVWTATTSPDFETFAAFVDFSTGYDDFQEKSSQHHVRCVRSWVETKNPIGIKEDETQEKRYLQALLKAQKQRTVSGWQLFQKSYPQAKFVILQNDNCEAVDELIAFLQRKPKSADGNTTDE